MYFKYFKIDYVYIISYYPHWLSYCITKWLSNIGLTWTITGISKIGLSQIKACTFENIKQK